MRVLTLAQAMGLKEVPSGGLAWHALLLGPGLPTAGLRALAKVLGVKEAAVAHYIGLTPAQLAARKKGKHLTPQESDRVYRVARAAVQAAGVVGDLGAAATWLRTPHPQLKMAPLEALLSTIGAEYVHTLLTRMAPVTLDHEPDPDPDNEFDAEASDADAE